MFDLKKFRTDYKLTQVRLAEILNCSQTSVNFIEKGTRELSDTQRNSLYSIYGDLSEYEVEKIDSDKENDELIYAEMQKWKRLAIEQQETIKSLQENISMLIQNNSMLIEANRKLTESNCSIMDELFKKQAV